MEHPTIIFAPRKAEAGCYALATRKCITKKITKMRNTIKRKWNVEEMKEAARDARRALERERERMMEKAELMDGFFEAMDAVTEVMAENERLRDENEALRQQTQEVYVLQVAGDYNDIHDNEMVRYGRQ
jgi:soluble cytochrome b562